MSDVIQKVRTVFSADSSALRADISRLTSSFSRLQNIALGLAGSYGLGSVIKGLVEVNAKSETSAIGIATMVQAADRMRGQMTPFTNALGIAKSTLEDLRQVAVDTPATFDQVAESFRAIVFPARTAGMSMKAIAQLAGDVATLESAEGSPGLISRDIAQLLRGTNNVDSQFLRPFKDELLKLVKQGNQAGAIKRIGEIIQIDPEARRAFGDSFEGKVSTFQDQIQAIQRAAGAPLFEVANEYLAKMSKWLTENKDEVKRIAKEVGEGLVKAFLAVKNAVEWLIKSGVGEIAIKVMLGVKAVGLLGGAFSALGPILSTIAANPIWALLIAAAATIPVYVGLAKTLADPKGTLFPGGWENPHVAGSREADAFDLAQYRKHGFTPPIALEERLGEAAWQKRGAVAKRKELEMRQGEYETQPDGTMRYMGTRGALAAGRAMSAAEAEDARRQARLKVTGKGSYKRSLKETLAKNADVNVDARYSRVSVNVDKIESDDPSRFADVSVKSAFLGIIARPMAAISAIGGVSSGSR